MSASENSQEIYEYVDSIARNLLDVNEEEMGALVEEEFGMDIYPLNTDTQEQGNSNNVSEYMKAGFSISSILAERYPGSDDIFFRKRSEDFSGFSQELGRDDQGFYSRHLIQYASLYTEIAEEEGIDTEIDNYEVALQNLEEKKQSVRELLFKMEQETSAKLEA